MYRKLLEMVSRTPLNDWERGFMQSICNSKTLKFSDKQKDIILKIANKSYNLNYDEKTLLRVWLGVHS